MCGIVGYTGTSQATDILIDGLKRMEYRGYDSAGIAVQTDAGLVVRRKVGKVSGLEAIVASEHIEGTCGIGHTRWAVSPDRLEPVSGFTRTITGSASIYSPTSTGVTV